LPVKAGDIEATFPIKLENGERFPAHAVRLAPSRWADSSSAPLHPAPPSSPTIGALTRSWANAAIAIPYRHSGAERHASCRDLPADHSPRVLQSQNLAARHPSRCQSAAPTSLSQRIHPSASTAASTLSTPSVLYSASPAMSQRPHTQISTLQNHDSLHLVGVCDNPISTIYSTTPHRAVEHIKTAPRAAIFIAR
jgi:hypothetical protein